VPIRARERRGFASPLTFNADEEEAMFKAAQVKTARSKPKDSADQAEETMIAHNARRIAFQIVLVPLVCLVFAFLTGLLGTLLQAAGLLPATPS
jgi:hypothetical protein